MNKAHVAEVGDEAGNAGGEGAIAGGPVDEEGFAEQEALGDPAAFDEEIFGGGEIDIIDPGAGVATEDGVVAEDEVFVFVFFSVSRGRAGFVEDDGVVRRGAGDFAGVVFVSGGVV